MAAPLLAGQSVPIRVAFEPVSNALNSFALLNEVEHLSGLDAWVGQTAAALTSEQRLTNRLVFEGLRDALLPPSDEPNFPSYLHNLGEMNAYVLRLRVLESLRRDLAGRTASAIPPAKYLLSGLQTFLDSVKSVQGEALFDSEIQTRVFTLLNDPSALQQVIISHLDQLWRTTTFAAEWRRVQPHLRWQVEMFTRSLEADLPLDETFYEFTGRQLPANIPGVSENTAEVVLIPSWHTGRHVIAWNVPAWDGDDWGGQEILRLFFSEPPNYDVSALRSTPVKRAELRARLSALADDTRLRIIELLTQQNELSAQDIIATLELSQSSVSRHLKQLVSMGYLYERRSEGANKTYRLSAYYLERTARALRQLLEEEPAQDEYQEQTTTYARELKRFVDRHGRLTMWPPARQRDKLLILEYLVSFFEPGREYAEKEVNELLLQHSTVKDPAALRRALYEFRFLNRERDGSLYWLIGSKE